MAKANPVHPVKLILALLWADEEAREKALASLEEAFGSIDYVGEDHPFDHTEYYEEEMGPNLKRRMISFLELAPPESIVEAKITCNSIEEEIALPARRVNLDIGYLDSGKVVLASFKSAGHKILLGRGVYADLIARYHHRHYQPLDWTFPDFRNHTYDSNLVEIRRTFLKQIRQTPSSES